MGTEGGVGADRSEPEPWSLLSIQTSPRAGTQYFRNNICKLRQQGSRSPGMGRGQTRCASIPVRVTDVREEREREKKE